MYWCTIDDTVHGKNTVYVTCLYYCMWIETTYIYVYICNLICIYGKWANVDAKVNRGHHRNHHHHHHLTWYSNIIHQSLFPHRSFSWYLLFGPCVSQRPLPGLTSVDSWLFSPKFPAKLRVAPNQPSGFGSLIPLIKGCFNTPLEHTPKPLPTGYEGIPFMVD